MKQINYILILLLFANCSSTKNLSKNNLKPHKFVFKKSMVSSEIGIENLKSLQDSLLNNIFKEEIQLSDLLNKTPDTEIYIEVQNDSVWRYTMQDGIMIGDYIMIKKNSGTLFYYDKSKSVNYRKYDLFAQNQEYEIFENKEEKKKINGFDCYKLTM